MIPVNCIIIDDNEIDRMVIEDYLQHHPSMRLMGSFSNPLESMCVLRTGEVKVIFMDINMPVMNGVDFFKTVPNPPLCIFITDHPGFATDAFEVHALDYLLKPICRERFGQAIYRLNELLNIRSKALQYDMYFENDTLTIKEGTSINKLMVNDIIYLEAITNYTKIVTAARRYITLSNLKNLMDKLPEKKFVRIHRSYAVAVDKINRIANKELFTGEVALPIGKTYRHEINTFMIRKPLSLN